jgi:hypothetical protein
MMDFKTRFGNYNLTLAQFKKTQEEGGNLRFDRCGIIASDVASQFYCEKKVEIQYLYGKVETEEKISGTQAHEALTMDALKADRSSLWEKIFLDKPIFVLEMLLLAKYKNVLLAGKPDSVLFKEGIPLLVLEYKFSKSDVAYPSYHVQAQTYGFLLEQMGFNTERLSYVIVVANPLTKGNRDLRKNVIRKVVANRSEIGSHLVEGAKIYINKYNRLCAEMDLNWALEYWMGKREAKPTNNHQKCKKCEYFDKCS